MEESVKCVVLQTSKIRLSANQMQAIGPENRKICICFLEPSWVAMRTYVKGGATRGVNTLKKLDPKAM
eukprot:2982998-Ditylum_brightwellii.AAC.1